MQTKDDRQLMMSVVDLTTCRKGGHSMDVVQGQSLCSRYRALALIKSRRRQAERDVCCTTLGLQALCGCCSCCMWTICG